MVEGSQVLPLGLLEVTVVLACIKGCLGLLEKLMLLPSKELGIRGFTLGVVDQNEEDGTSGDESP